MPRYFLTRIRVEGFRGINNEGDPLDLRFHPGAVNSVFAVNGIGKSSLFEALSYALRGSIPKLEALLTQEQPERYYCNRFHSQQHATIDIELEPDDGSPTPISVRVERSSLGQRTVSSPSGYPDPVALLASLNEDFTLLDYRTFSRFIDDTPLDRGRSFSALLGLSAYSDIRQSLQSASETRTLNSDLELTILGASITETQRVSQRALTSLRTNYERVIGHALEDVSRLDECMTEVARALGDVQLLKPHFHGKSLDEVDFEATKKAIREAEGGEHRRELERVVETLTRLEALGILDTAATKTEQEKLSSFLVERDALLSETSGDLFNRLYEAARALMSEGVWTNDSQCPLCLTSLGRSIKEHIDGQLEQYGGVAKKMEQIGDSWREAQWVHRLDILEKTETLVLTEGDGLAVRSGQRAVSGRLGKDELTSAIERLAELEDTLAGKLRELNARREELERELPQSLVQLTEQVEYGRQFNESARLFLDKQKEGEAYRAQLDTRNRWRQFITRATAVFSEAEAELSKAKIADIDAEYKSMFKNIMKVSDVVPDLRRVDDGEHLHVQLSEFHGQHRLSAPALLSESYRNALAISVFLAAAVTHSGPPRFVVLDDVTSSFDAGHQFFLMELIRTKLQQPANTRGLQFIILSHDGLLEKYFDKLGSSPDWHHHKLQGSPPMEMILSQAQDAGRLRNTIESLLTAGQVTQAEPLIRPYLEYKLLQIIRKVDIPVPIDFAMKDHSKMVSNCLDAIRAGVDLQIRAGTIVLDAQQLQDIGTVHVPALVGNWIAHYETGAGSSLSAPMLRGVVESIDDLAECFRFDDNSGGTTTRKWYRSLSSRT